MIPLKDQLKCARRELAMRRRSFPKWVATGQMTADQAKHETDAMEAITETLEKQVMLEEVSIEIRGTEPPFIKREQERGVVSTEITKTPRAVAPQGRTAGPSRRGTSPAEAGEQKSLF
jgi:hypothetical protein